MRGRATVRTVALSALVACGLASAADAAGSHLFPVEIHVDLAHHSVVAGHSIKGMVVLTNTTTKRITVQTCADDGWLEVGLTGHVDSYPFGNALIACAATVRLAPGPNRFPVTVLTTYASCTQPQPASGSTPTPTTPTCTVAGPPPLPAGRYATKLNLIGLGGLTQAPNRVLVSLSKPRHEPPLAPCADVPGVALPQVTVPNVVGASSSAAALVLARACLNAGYTSPVKSQVISEAPTAGSTVPEHSTVTLSTR
jgi:PASTA domain